MENKPLITIVVPIYNVEAYVKRCVDSIIRQTYKNIEILLVDDGSPDKSGEICEQYKKIDNRILVYHKTNGGLSDARNYGIARAKGKFITFIDSDDYIAPTYIEYLYDMVARYNAEISACCMIKTNKDTADFSHTLHMPTEQVFTGKEACFQLFGRLYLTLVTAWGKLYSTDIVKMNLFPKGKKHEDEATTCKFYYNSTKVVVGNRCLYAYYQNFDGITHSIGNKINYDEIWALSHRAYYFNANKEFLLEKYSWGKLLDYLINDSLKNDYRCDNLIGSFLEHRTLNPKKLFELQLYNSSHMLYKQYIKLYSLASMVKRKIKPKNQMSLKSKKEVSRV